MDGSYLNPRNTGPNSEPTVALNTFVPGEYGPSPPLLKEGKRTLSKIGQYPPEALTSDFASDKVANSILKKPSVFSTRTPNFNLSLGRIAEFESASPLVKEILVVLYGTRDNFVAATGHPLEPYIFAFDSNLDSGETVRAIGSAIGIYVDTDPNFFAYELFLDKLISCIAQLEVKRIDDVKYVSRPKIGTIINMSRKEFSRYLEEDGIPFSENLYQDRMNYFRFMSQTEEEKFEELNQLPQYYDTTRKPNTEPQSSSLIREKYYRQGF